MFNEQGKCFTQMESHSIEYRQHDFFWEIPKFSTQKFSSLSRVENENKKNQIQSALKCASWRHALWQHVIEKLL